MKLENKNSLKPQLNKWTIGAVKCCELCGETIHNHIDCPVCKSNYASTDQYCDLYDEKEVTCEDCGTTFAKTTDSWYYDCKAKIVSLGKNCH